MDKISIYRFSTNDKTDKSIGVMIEDEEANVIYKGEMTLEDFAKCITAMSCCDIERVEEVI